MNGERRIVMESEGIVLRTIQVLSWSYAEEMTETRKGCSKQPVDQDGIRIGYVWNKYATPALWIPSCRIMGPHDAILRAGRHNIWYRHAHKTMLIIRGHIWYTASAVCNSGVHFIRSGEHQAMQIAGLHETGTHCSEQLRRMKWVQTERGNGMLLNCLITLMTLPPKSICEHLV
jgi:hypothetical protein